MEFGEFLIKVLILAALQARFIVYAYIYKQLRTRKHAKKQTINQMYHASILTHNHLIKKLFYFYMHNVIFDLIFRSGAFVEQRLSITPSLFRSVTPIHSLYLLRIYRFFLTWLLPVERRPLTRDGSTKWQVSTGRDRRCAKVRKGRIGNRRAGVEEVTGF